MKNLCVINFRDYTDYVRMNANFSGRSETETRNLMSKKILYKRKNENYEILFSEGFKGYYHIFVTDGITEKCFSISLALSDAEKSNPDNIITDNNHVELSEEIADKTGIDIERCWKTFADEILYTIRYFNKKKVID